MNGDSYKYIRYNASQETRWATEEEIMKNTSRIALDDEDYDAAGIPILCDGKEAYVDSNDTHTLIFGATGSKKTRLFVMPTVNIMIKAGESFIVTDPKGEIYAQTSGLAKEKDYKTVVLNFRDIGIGDTWNPLALPYELWRNGYRDEAGMLLSDIVSSIAGPLTGNTKDAFWPESAQELAIAHLYLLMEAAKPEEVNMKSFAELSSYGNIQHIKEVVPMMREDCIAALNYNSTVCTDARQTISGIVSTLFGMLRLFSVNDKLSLMLSDSSFDIRQFGREKTAVYVIVPDEKTTYHFLVTMFVKQVYEVLIEEAQKETKRMLPVRVNFVLDEFCNIPMIADMPAMISAARSRNMRYFLVVQSQHQLRGKYGEDADTIKGNCDNWVFLTSKELDLLNEISALCGTIITPGGQTRRLVSTSELQRFSKERGEALIMHARQYPIIAELPDISDYSMFGKNEPVSMTPQDKKTLKCFSISAFLKRVEEQEAIAPFASESHLRKQARDIYIAAQGTIKEEIVSRVQEEYLENKRQELKENRRQAKLRRQKAASDDGDSSRQEKQSLLALLHGRNPEDDDIIDPRDRKILDEIFEGFAKNHDDGVLNNDIDDDRDDADDGDFEVVLTKADELEIANQHREEVETRSRELAKKRIAALIGEEYAERFFEEKLYEYEKSKPCSKGWDFD